MVTSCCGDTTTSGEMLNLFSDRISVTTVVVSTQQPIDFANMVALTNFWVRPVRMKLRKFSPGSNVFQELGVSPQLDPVEVVPADK